MSVVGNTDADHFACQFSTLSPYAQDSDVLIHTPGVDRSYASRLLRFTLLAPDIVEAILDGREPSGFSVTQFARAVPEIWDEQREKYGFRTASAQSGW